MRVTRYQFRSSDTRWVCKYAGVRYFYNRFGCTLSRCHSLPSRGTRKRRRKHEVFCISLSRLTSSSCLLMLPEIDREVTWSVAVTDCTVITLCRFALFTDCRYAVAFLRICEKFLNFDASLVIFDVFVVC